jgi:hypothetical protein
MQSPELTPTPSAKLFIPPDSPTAISALRLSGVMGARDDLLDERSLTTLTVVVGPIPPLQRPLWPAFVIGLALLLALVWSGTLVWLIYRTCRLLLSTLF